MSWPIGYFENSRDESPVKDFIKNQEKKLRAKIMHEIDLLERFGPHLALPHSRKIENDLWELRIRGETQVRILYTFINKTIVLLHVFRKSQKIPVKELDIARDRISQI